ncbi:rhotekin [Aplysia californica]|uniref:Rhotekin n=1 Tax=Aplysia californica TaxID=6500 RepID=A0ABM1A3H9_APLCA|nr:rhotekin [Aplysia californica]
MAQQIDMAEEERDFQFDFSVEDGNILCEELLPSTLPTKMSRRRQTIHGNEIRKENDAFSTVKGSNSRKRVKRSASGCSVGNFSPLSTAVVPQSHNVSFTGVVKGTLKRHVSSCVLKHKLKKFQDYSLPYKHDAFAMLRETCNVRKQRTSPTKPLTRSQTSATPPPKPPRQRTPRKSTLSGPKSGGAENSPVWKLRQEKTKLKESDHDLQQKIDHEIKMREGTARLLVASKHPAQVLEAAKNLLSSNTRIIAYMSELQRRKTAEVLGKHTSHEGNQLPCRAQVSVSDIRIPLMWKDADHFKNKGDYRRYAVFCLLKVGTEIFDTSMISNVDRSMTDITFEDIVLFEDVPHDFEMKLEVYCHKLHEEFSVANTPKKLKKKINDISGSVGRSVGKRLSGLNDADVIGNMVLGPKFELVAKGSLSLSDVDNSVRTFDLQLETNSEGQVPELPLFGHYCCRLAALPQCLVQPTVTGFLNLQEDDDLSKWKRYWCSLKNLQLACWSSPDDVEVTQPLLSIPVTKSTQISDADPSTSRKPHSFLIKTVNLNGIFHHTLAADSKEDLNRWWDGFQQHLLDQALWKHACDELMDLKVGTRRKVPAFLRKSSLYDETPLIDPEGSTGDKMVGDLGLGDDQLSQMLHTLMGEASQIRGGASSQS